MAPPAHAGLVSVHEERRTVQAFTFSRRIGALAVLALLAAAYPGSVGAQTQTVANDLNGDGNGDLLVGSPLEDLGKLDQAGIVHAIYSNGDTLRAARNRAVSRPRSQREDGDSFGSSVEIVDVNNDGFGDAIVGASGVSVGEAARAGQITVHFGSKDGIRKRPDQIIRQGIDGAAGAGETGDLFGFSSVGADFNGDGFGDVAVSAPYETVADQQWAGAVTVFYGSANGLDPASSIELTQAAPEAGDNFGWVLAAGDFDGNGLADLAVGAPGEDVGNNANAGAVAIFGDLGSNSAQQTGGFSQAGAVKERPEANDLFGFALGVADLNCDGHDDLGVGVPNESIGGIDPAGMVNVLLGSSGGLTTAGNKKLTQRSRRVAGTLGYNQFGAALAGGNFDGDKCGDLAIGAHTTDVGSDGRRLCSNTVGCVSEAGAVVVVYGHKAWPKKSSSAEFSQRGPVAGAPEAADFFGRTLAVIDTNGDGRDELVVGAPSEDIGNRRDAGGITVLIGSRGGLTGAGSYGYSQAGPIKGKPERFDQFGSSLLDGGS